MMRAKSDTGSHPPRKNLNSSIPNLLEIIKQCEIAVEVK